MHILKKIKKTLNIILKRQTKLSGNYRSWEQALKLSKGYNDNIIFEKTVESLEKVLSKQAIFERDSFLFYKESYDETLLLIFKKIKIKIKKIKLCDFGGSLGSLYFQHRSLFKSNLIEWNIVEQKHFVKYANDKIKIKNLHFYDNLNFILKKKINVALFSSSLQYLRNPYQILDKMIKKKIPNIIIHRSPFTKKNETIKIQHVPKYIYDASYPIRILNVKNICNKFNRAGYKMIAKYTLKEEIDGYFYETFYFEKKEI
jgi:putative methyltransferase (TIGR04325 family)